MRQDLDRQTKIDFILDHYESPRHYGALEDATVVQKGGNPGCGDIVTFYLKLDGDGADRRISFEAEGAPSARPPRPW
jgi:nitrogen fixation NifU-like protein